MNSWKITSFLLLLLVIRSLGLNTDGILLLSFKYSVLKDPLMVLKNWNYEDHNPCSWNGVRCSNFSSLPGSYDTNRVISLILPQSKLLGSIPANLGMIQHLQYLDLSNNFLNGSLPFSLFNASELKLLSLSNNAISGQLPDFVVDGLKSLETLNLSDNALTGNLPTNLSSLQNVRVISLKNNYLFGEIPSGFENVEFLDLSSNLINGSLPENIGGNNLHYLNLSSNKISGEIPLEFGNRIPESATIDISFNNLTGEVPETKTFLSQETNSFSSNPDLCGKILRNPCKIPSSSSTLNNSPPAIAAIPTTPDSSLENGSKRKDRNRLKPGSIVGIVVGDLVGIGILAMVFLYVYKLRKKKKQVTTNKITEKTEEETSNSSGNSCFCLGNRCVNDEESSETTNSEEEDEDDEEEKVGLNQKKKNQQLEEEEERKKGKLVIVDGETELELETLLKASAYILGTTGSSIVYKAVLEDGTVLAVRRIGETGFERFRDFENQVRGIAKLKHPNLVNIRGFYWGSDEKLVIYDHVPNGNLANVTYKRGGSSPYHLPWEVRLKIAKGVARGLTYLHDKKHVHSNLKPTNILLGLDMDPKISDFGLGKLMWGESSHKAGGSARSFSSKRWLVSRESQQDLATSSTPSPSSVGGGSSLYQAPESLRNLKPNPKWDVYSFGMVLLELLSGKIFCDTELAHWEGGIVLEERSRVLRMADLAIRGDVVEDDLITCFKLGFSCASVVAAKRPSMKEVLQVLETISSSSSLRYYDY